MDSVQLEIAPPVAVVAINRPHRRNAVDPDTAVALREAFAATDADDAVKAVVFTGRDGYFCAGYDLQAFSETGGEEDKLAALGPGEPGPMGPSRHHPGKPTIAAVEGYAVAGGLELAIWADLRVAAEDAIFGVFCRRWGVPLIDGGTVRLPRLIGQGRALDLILTSRPVTADEALRIGLVDRVVPKGQTLEAATQLAREIAAFPQECSRWDRTSTYEALDLDFAAALDNEARGGLEVLRTGESRTGATRFAKGAGRSGSFAD